jgi:hypothetical protein
MSRQRHRHLGRPSTGFACLYHRHMTRDPDATDGEPLEGGGAAERLREFLAARFGNRAPSIPPDEDAQSEADVAARPAEHEDADAQSSKPACGEGERQAGDPAAQD